MRSSLGGEELGEVLRLVTKSRPDVMRINRLQAFTAVALDLG